MRAIHHVLFLKMALAKIKLAKELFILDLEQGNEVFIISELSQHSFPMSMCYYDSLLNYCHEFVSQDTRRFFKFKNHYRMNFFRNENIQQKVLVKLGVQDEIDDQYQGKKLTFKHSIVNKKELKNIDHNTSIHAKSL